MTLTISNEMIKQLIQESAYYKWQAAGCPEGKSGKFWLEAEKEVLHIPDRIVWSMPPILDGEWHIPEIILPVFDTSSLKDIDFTKWLDK